MSKAPQRLVLLGRIASAHGIRGEVLIKSFTADPADIAAYGPLTDETGGDARVVRVVRVTPKGVVARIDGIADRTAAEALAGRSLYAPRAQLPAPADDEFYIEDLIGLTAVDADGGELGTIVAVPNYGAGDLVEIRLAGASRTEFVPFTKACVPTIDLAAGRATIVMPASVNAEPEGGEAGNEDGELDGADTDSVDPQTVEAASGASDLDDPALGDQAAGSDPRDKPGDRTTAVTAPSRPRRMPGGEGGRGRRR